MAARAVVLFFLSSAPSLLAEECGLVSSNVETEVSADNRILGGAHVPVEGLPWQVVLFFFKIQKLSFRSRSLWDSDAMVKSKSAEEPFCLKSLSYLPLIERGWSKDSKNDDLQALWPKQMFF